MSDWVIGSLKFLAVELPKVLKQNLLRTILAAILLTLLVQAAFLNPWFGSTKIKAQLFSAVIGDSAEVEQLITYVGNEDKDTAKMFRIGAARAGYYTAENAGLLEEWESEAKRLTWNGVETERNLTALRDARFRAEELLTPFQIVGKEARASSPGCRRDRPPFDKVYVNPRRNLGRLLKPGNTVKIVNERGGGRPVIATVEYPDNVMPEDIDMSLNKQQMVDMLGQVGPVVKLRVTNVAASPNQPIDDDHPQDGICATL